MAYNWLSISTKVIQASPDESKVSGRLSLPVSPSLIVIGGRERGERREGEKVEREMREEEREREVDSEQ